MLQLTFSTQPSFGIRSGFALDSFNYSYYNDYSCQSLKRSPQQASIL